MSIDRDDLVIRVNGEIRDHGNGDEELIRAASALWAYLERTGERRISLDLVNEGKPLPACGLCGKTGAMRLTWQGWACGFAGCGWVENLHPHLPLKHMVVRHDTRWKESDQNPT